MRRVIAPNNRDINNMSTISFSADGLRGKPRDNWYGIRDNTPPIPNGRYRDEHSVTGYRNVRRSVQRAHNSK